MRRVVLDTNIVVSGLLWSGTSQRVLQAIRDGQVQALVSEAMLDELQDVLQRPKFAPRFERLGQNPQQLFTAYSSYVIVINVEPLDETVSVDPDDDIFIACAVSGKADYVVSGDPHLLTIGEYHGIQILTAPQFLERLAAEQNDSDDR